LDRRSHSGGRSVKDGEKGVFGKNLKRASAFKNASGNCNAIGVSNKKGELLKC
jgi:hypothetical protein